MLSISPDKLEKKWLLAYSYICQPASSALIVTPTCLCSYTWLLLHKIRFSPHPISATLSVSMTEDRSSTVEQRQKLFLYINLLPDIEHLKDVLSKENDSGKLRNPIPAFHLCFETMMWISSKYLPSSISNF